MKLNKLIKDIESDYLKLDLPSFKIGNIVSIDVLIQEGNKKRIQSYNGKIISQHLAGLNSTITVRRLSKGIGIERIFPIHSPDIKSINLIEK
jgi:large subunit ribosomal protein L19|uniref:Ribosomal protein L19 n=2 Tax=Ulva TaxID=3118 RepID=A0A288QZ04_ULVPR|nr:ribosomal protein L19 [Ulva linza]YP_009440071.1 ribosomal protein L19 [Ulva prolifera]ANH54386.1 ribosomal protein L19 [Ulva linza]AOT99408.1 ribosomal protein L19 [Ulva prolifera]UEN67746.1 ribosomal protein L19 [Ulva prolifera]WFS79766.1 ribosomal protein L19 [Ulva prolifera]WFS79843.1 ribosomal protein L19 [Ulva prolifera]